MLGGPLYRSTMPRIRAETLCSPTDLFHATGIAFGSLIPIGKPTGFGRAMPGLSTIQKDMRGLYTIWASYRGDKPVLLYGGKCVSESGIRHRILTHFLRSQNEGKPGRLHLNGGSYLFLLFEHMGLSAEYFVSIAPISDTPITHAKEKALLFQIDFIANDAENSGRRGDDLKRLFTLPTMAPAVAPVDEEPVVEVTAEVEVASVEAEVEPTQVVKEKPKKVKKIKKAPDAKVLRLTTDLTEAQTRIAELEARVSALEAEKGMRKTLKADLRIYEDAVGKLASIYAGNVFLESAYVSAVGMRDKIKTELEAMDL